MQTVAKFQFTTKSKGEEVIVEIEAIINQWKDQKLSKIGDNVIIRRSGASAVFETLTDTIENWRRDNFTILEQVDGGELQTSVDVLAAADRTVFRCILSMNSNIGIAPADVFLRAPRFVRKIVALKEPWMIRVSDERIFAHSFLVDTDDISELEKLIFAPERRLPIVIVSELLGETLAGDLHERMGQDLCSIAHTVRLSQEASWELTHRRGREWSCYNGAVRLFWPFRSKEPDFRTHPLWTLDQIMSRATGEVQARDRIRNIITDLVIEASNFATDDPAFHEFEVRKIRQAADQAKALATDDGDIEALASAYARENDALRMRVDEQDSELGILRENIETLNIALRSSQAVKHEESDLAPPQTVEEAVAIARIGLVGKIIIANETDSDIANLNPASGPPDKILRYLRVLADLADALETSNSLGKSVPLWLRDHGVDCSVDSETMKASKEGRRFRIRVINGENVDCEFHAKPSEGVSPDMCTRIYFAISNSTPFVKIGYIGRHII